MGIDLAVPVEKMPGGSALHRDYVLERGTAVHAAIGEFRAGAADWTRAAERAPRVDGRLVDRLVAWNRELGVHAGVLDGLRRLAAGSARAIIAGQQPGVAGGPLMTLHKVATVCALARSLERSGGVPCVPLFWMGADDDDFAEIRELVVPAGDLSLLSASLPAAAYVPGRRVGDIAAGAVRDVWNAVASHMPGGEERRAEVGSWLAGARDLGDAAARSIVALAGGEVAVVDGREPLLRECARDLLLGFFDREEELRALVGEGGRRLEAAGYHAQLALGESSGLFLVEDGVRRKIPPERRTQARARFEADVTAASPGVVARSLMQDSVFAPLAVVMGPAEIAYRAQIAGVYDALGVPRPVVFPRMTATFVPPAVVELAQAARLDASAFALDPAGITDAARERLRDGAFGAAARAAEDDFAGLVRRFTGAAGARLDERNREKLEKRLADLAQRLRQALNAAVELDRQGAGARFPFLGHVPELFVRAGVPQERYLSMMVPHVFHGRAAWAALRSIADESVAAALDGRAGHRVYSV